MPRPPHGDRRPGPRPGDRISRQQGRGVRSQDREVHRICVPAIHQSVPGQLRQERRDLGFDHEHRPRGAARSEDQQVRAISDAERHQHAHGVRRQFDQPGDVLGRLQPRPSDREGRAVGLGGGYMN